MAEPVQRVDAVVVGAGPAGLIAATYLARFRRTVVVLDGGPPRAVWIPESHNTPGFPGGIGGRELLARLREQAQIFGAQIVPAKASTLDREADGFLISLGDRTIAASTVLIATGLVDNKPDIPDLEAAILRSVVRMCPICDAFEAVGERIAVLGDGPLGVREAAFLRGYSDDVTLLHLGEFDADKVDDLGAGGLQVLKVETSAVRFDHAGVTVTTAAGVQVFDRLYLALGCHMNSELAIAAGAACDEDRNLRVDAHQRTSIPGLYAAGDVVRGLNQITVAGGEAAIAATAIHNALRRSIAPAAAPTAGGRHTDERGGV